MMAKGIKKAMTPMNTMCFTVYRFFPKKLSMAESHRTHPSHPLGSPSFPPLSRGSSGTEWRDWASVLTVTSVQLCVKRLLAHPAWGLELLAYFAPLPCQLAIHGSFYEQSSTRWGYPNNPRHVFAN
jgi:hypothetical protein